MTIPERIMQEARAIFNERDVLGSIARAILAAEQRGAASSKQAVPARRVRHLKRGSEYSVIAHGRLQVDGDLDNEKVTVYRGDDGQVWVRPDYEFNDGRFEDIEVAPASPSPASDITRVTVKPLEWTNDGGRLWSATCPHTFLNYAVMTRSSGLTEWRGSFGWIDAKSVEAGKRRAQSDYERRILSALQFTDQKGDGHE